MMKPSSELAMIPELSMLKPHLISEDFPTTPEQIEDAVRRAQAPAVRYAYCRGYGILTREDAEELAADCLIYAARKYDAGRERPFRAFVFWAISKRVPDYIRRVRKYCCVPLNEFDANAIVANSTDGAGDSVLSGEFEKVELALSKVPAPYRMILELKVLRDVSYADIGKLTGMNLSTIRVHYFRGLKALRDLLGEQA